MGRLSHGAEGHDQGREDDQDDRGEDVEQGLPGTQLVLVLARVFDGHARGQGHLGGDAPLDVVDEAAQVPVADIGLDEDPQAPVLALDLVGADGALEVRHLAQLYRGPGGGGQRDLAQPVDVAAVRLLQAHLDGPALAALDGGADGGPADAGLHLAEDVLDAQTVAPEQFAADLDLQVGLALDPGGGDPGGPLHLVDHPLDLEGLGLEGVEVVAEDLDPDLGADAGAGHQDAVLDGLEESGHIARHVHQPLREIGDDGRLGGPRRPVRLGLEHDGGLDHLHRGRVRGAVGAAELAGHRGDRRVGAHHPVLPGHDALDLGERGGGEQHGHEEQRALFQGRHELAAEALGVAGDGLREQGVDRPRQAEGDDETDRQQRRRQPQHGLAVPQGPVERRARRPTAGTS